MPTTRLAALRNVIFSTRRATAATSANNGIWLQISAECAGVVRARPSRNSTWFSATPKKAQAASARNREVAQLAPAEDRQSGQDHEGGARPECRPGRGVHHREHLLAHQVVDSEEQLHGEERGAVGAGVGMRGTVARGIAPAQAGASFELEKS